MTYRNPKLTKLAKDAPCLNCGREDGTVVWAHSNLLIHGKGRSHKASDAAGMLLCHTCHSQLDQGTKMTKQERYEFQVEMIAATYIYLMENQMLEVSK